MHESQVLPAPGSPDPIGVETQEIATPDVAPQATREIDRGHPDASNFSVMWFRSRSGAHLTTDAPVRVFRHSPYDLTPAVGPDATAPMAQPWIALPPRTRSPMELLATLVHNEYHFLTSGEVCSVPCVTLIHRTRHECEPLVNQVLSRPDEWTAFVHSLGYQTFHHDEEFCTGMLNIRPTDQRISRFERLQCEEGDRKRETVLVRQSVIALGHLVESMKDADFSPCLIDTNRIAPRVSFKCIEVYLDDPFWSRLWSKALLRKLFGVHLETNAALTKSRPISEAAAKALLEPSRIDRTLQLLRFSRSDPRARLPHRVLAVQRHERLAALEAAEERSLESSQSSVEGCNDHSRRCRRKQRAAVRSR